MSPALRPLREIVDKLGPKPEPQPLAQPGKRVEPGLAGGEEAQTLTRG